MAQNEVANVGVHVNVETRVDGVHLGKDHCHVQDFSKSKEKETHNWEQHMLHVDKAWSVFHIHHVYKFSLTVVGLIEMFD